MENKQIRKVFLIQQNCDAAIAALNHYLDYIYSLKDDFYDENGQLKPDLEHDSEAEGLLERSKLRTDKLEFIREKLKNKDFNLSTDEISYIGAAFLFSAKTMEIHASRLKEAASLADFLQREILENKTIEKES